MPLLPVIGGVVAPMLGAWTDAGVMDKLNAGTPLEAAKAMLNEISLRYIGYQPFVGYQTTMGFNFDKVIPTYGGLIAGVVGHMVATKFGINRQMKRIPFLGKYVQL